MPRVGQVHGGPPLRLPKAKDGGPNGIIMVTGDYKKSGEVAEAGSKLAESLVITEEKRQLERLVALSRERPVPGKATPVLA